MPEDKLAKLDFTEFDIGGERNDNGDCLTVSQEGVPITNLQVYVGVNNTFIGR